MSTNSSPIGPSPTAPRGGGFSAQFDAYMRSQFGPAKLSDSLIAEFKRAFFAGGTTAMCIIGSASQIQNGDEVVGNLARELHAFSQPGQAPAEQQPEPSRIVTAHR